MGQRSQIIVKTPKYYINKNNPNNRNEPSFNIYHNQWLYGFGFIQHLKDIIEQYEKYKKWYKQSELNQFEPDYIDFIEKAVLTANYKDITNIRKSHSIFRMGTEDGDIFDKAKNWESIFDRLDNNNGFIFLNINKKGDISFDITSGLEDTESYERKTPKEYLQLFYKKIEIETDHECQQLLRYLKKFKQINHKKIELPKVKK